MEQKNLIIRNARILSSDGDQIGDVGVSDGKITAIDDVPKTTVAEIDATGYVLTPGGVDVHAHIEQMSGMGLMNADTFETATRSAALGGTTSVVSFAPQSAAPRLSEAVEDYAKRARAGAMIDYAFHIILNDMTAKNLVEDLTALIAAGHRSIKIFTTYNIQLSDRDICEVLGIAKEAGALVCVHAENDGLIGWTKDHLLATGKTQPKHHALSHPRLAEIEAVERLIRFAEYFATPVMLFHISTHEAVDAVRGARARGVPVWAETCPHYLFMTEEVLDRPGIEGAKWMCSPPQRKPTDQDALWAGLSDGTLDLVSSDHAPYRFDETGKLSNGTDVDFSKIANGLPGLEVRMPLMFDAMMQGRMSPTEFVTWCCTNPARIHGLPGKGDIQIGFDADLVLWDPTSHNTYGANDLHDNVGYNPWLGKTITGKPETVFLRGQRIVKDGALTGKCGQGDWIARPTLGVSTIAAPAAEYVEATT
ncbi:MAG: dihydropyrimidinase [Boseongicola sp.]|nr:dihydropyrimidinase [Boseongicola sp.]NNJ68068.1 dihydropyrimidinase [Boseongicola sp.]